MSGAAYDLTVARVVHIGAVGRLNDAESELGRAASADEYITIDFAVFAELDDGRRFETATVYSQGGTRDGWGALEGRWSEVPVSCASVEEHATVMIGPDGRRPAVWAGISARLEQAGLEVPPEELFAAPFRVDLERRLNDVLTT
jgi:hypothetical protein